ncbi:HAD family hydrolase [Fredinandcohnia sp. QZ13]|uniref:HAD family hydrolase n=1 Tax=Fredinandcohnia sp. QZ13 TaxID=3073144 RepID=UPI0028532CA5|nr:HAD family hydrolase [Fredinandcohnia sp. QZ13]MDR4888071.1 HAD family hydrolase [Fredinandcohnia sp. QZ13]
MPDIKIVFLDIDGTILRPDDTIEQSTKNAVAQLKNKGIEVFLATGRPLHEITDIGDELSISSYIAYNGAFAVHNEETLFNEPLPPSLVDNLLKTSKENNFDIVLYSKNKNIFTSMESEIVKEFIRTFHLKKNALYDDVDKEDILGSTIITTQEHAEVKFKHIPEIHLSSVNVEGMKNCRDVIREKVNKGVAVKAVLNALQLSTEHAAAFGDGMNDKEMLSAVGSGFAMGNANPNLFSYAKYKTTDVENSGVFNGLKSIGLVE